VYWRAAGEESPQECEHRTANVPRQGDLNHGEILSAVRPAIFCTSLLDQNIFFYLGRYDSDIKFIAFPAVAPRAGCGTVAATSAEDTVSENYLRRASTIVLTAHGEKD
jgi:hypothetical protein